MDELEEKLASVADRYLSTSKETEARDAVHLLKKLRYSSWWAVRLDTLLTESPRKFESLVEEAIAKLQADPPEPNSIFLEKIPASELREAILGPSVNDQSARRALCNRNMFFLIYRDTYLYEKNYLLKGDPDYEPGDGFTPSPLPGERRQKPRPGKTYIDYYRRLIEQKRKAELEKARLEWKRQNKGVE
jgi:hypothetical protein